MTYEKSVVGPSMSSLVVLASIPAVNTASFTVFMYNFGTYQYVVVFVLVSNYKLGLIDKLDWRRV